MSATSREMVARMHGKPVVPCFESCAPPSAFLRKLKEMINARWGWE